MTDLVRTVNISTWDLWRNHFESQEKGSDKRYRVIFQTVGDWEFSIRRDDGTLYKVTRNIKTGKIVLDPF
jgi:hypothetical protein